MRDGFVDYINNLKYPEKFVTKLPENKKNIDVKGKHQNQKYSSNRLMRDVTF